MAGCPAENDRLEAGGRVPIVFVDEGQDTLTEGEAHAEIDLAMLHGGNVRNIHLTMRPAFVAVGLSTGSAPSSLRSITLRRRGA